MDFTLSIGPHVLQGKVSQKDALVLIRFQDQGITRLGKVGQVDHAVKGVGVAIAVGVGGRIVDGDDAQHILESPGPKL